MKPSPSVDRIWSLKQSSEQKRVLGSRVGHSRSLPQYSQTDGSVTTVRAESVMTQTCLPRGVWYHALRNIPSALDNERLLSDSKTSFHRPAACKRTNVSAVRPCSARYAVASGATRSSPRSNFVALCSCSTVATWEFWGPLLNKGRSHAHDFKRT